MENLDGSSPSLCSYLIGITASNPFSEVVYCLISIRVDGKNRCERLITHLGLGLRLRLLRLTDSLPAASVALLMPPAGGPMKCNWTEHTSPDGIHLLMDTSTTATAQLVKANIKTQGLQGIRICRAMAMPKCLWLVVR